MSLGRNIKRFVPHKLKVFLCNIFFNKPEIQYLPLKKREALLKDFYKSKTGAKLNIKNPKLFTEKLQWYKLYYSEPDMKRCVDKIDFKDYVKEKIGEGYTARILVTWNSPEEVNIREVSKSHKKFVIKSTLQSDGNYIIPITDVEKYDIDAIEYEIKSNWFNSMNLLTNSFCSAYYGAKPRVLVEEFIEEFTDAANDYKLFCFHGKPAFFYVAEDHFKNGINSTTYPITFFDLDWNSMDVTYGEHATNKHVPRPKHLIEMVNLAQKLSEPFPFVRVDFFDTDQKLYLAELTFYPGGGLTPYHPESFNLQMGNMLTLPYK